MSGIKQIGVIDCEAVTLPLISETKPSDAEQHTIIPLRRYIADHADLSSALMVLNFEAADKNLNLATGSARKHLREAALLENYSVEVESPVMILLRRDSNCQIH